MKAHGAIGARSLGALAERCLSALLIAAIIASIAASFRYGFDRTLDGKLTITGEGQFVSAVCAILSQKNYGYGRYVCDGSQKQQMRDIGLWYDDEALSRIGKTNEQWRSDAVFLDSALDKAFALPPAPASGAMAFGWGGDAGYQDFVDFAFRVFGHRIESLYLGFFLLIVVSTILMCVQFWRNYFALLAVLAFQVGILNYLGLFDALRIGSLSNPRCLSFLAITPVFHALFLAVYRVRLDGRAFALFAPQALLIAAAADFRSLAYADVIALTACCLVLLLVDLWRQGLPLRQAVRRYWPIYTIFVCVALGVLLPARLADHRIAAIGGMRYHTFWEPLVYDLQLHPEWKEKYAAQFHNATGDAIAEVAAQSYRERHHLLHNKPDFIYGEESRGLTDLAYEKYVRDAYIEFVRNDPWFVVQLKYYNAIQVIDFVGHVMVSQWAALDWRILALAGLVAFALTMQIRQKTESLRRLTLCTGLLTLSGILVALPVWAMVTNVDLLTDLTLINVSASFLLAVWALVCVGVALSERVRRLVGSRPSTAGVDGPTVR